MARGIAMTADICRQPGDGFRAHTDNHAKQIQSLRRTRDLLLPHPLSWKLELSAAHTEEKYP
jgi:hypothetical protein